jgi:hypothetical protein
MKSFAPWTRREAYKPMATVAAIYRPIASSSGDINQNPFHCGPEDQDKIQGGAEDHEANGIGLRGHIGHRCPADPTAKADRLVAGPPGRLQGMTA